MAGSMPADEAGGGEGTTTGRASAPPLRRNRGFQLLWSGSAAYSLGSEAAEIAFPLLLLSLTGSPAWVGLFAAVQLLSAFLCGLPAGQVVDRRSPRSVLLWADGLRAAVMLAVAGAAYAQLLSVAVMLPVAAVLGAAMPFSGAARMLLLRSLVRPDQLTTALAQDEVRAHGAGLAGPPLAGLLYGFSATAALLSMGVLSLLSWATALFIRPPGEGRADGGRPGRGSGGMFAGLAALWNRSTLRAAILVVTALNTVGAPVVLLSVVVLREQSVPAPAVGVATAGLALGGLVGAALVKPLHARFRPGVILLAVAAVQVPVLAGLSVQLGPWWAAALLFCSTLGMPVLRVLVDILIFRQVPEEHRGRTIAAVMTLFTLGAPLGALLTSLLLMLASAGTALLVLGGGCAALILYAVGRRELREAAWPEPAA